MSPFPRLLQTLGRSVARHPARVVGLWLLAVLLSGLACLRLEPGTRLSDMLGQSSPEARAFNHVMDHYALADELLVVITAQDGAQVAPDALRQQAERTAQALRDSDELKKIGAEVRPPPSQEVRRFIETFAIRRAVSYLPPEAMPALHERLSEKEMRARFALLRARLNAPGAAGEIARQMAKDPLDLREFMPLAFPAMKAKGGAAPADRFDAGGRPKPPPPFEISKDGQAAVIHLCGTHAATDMPYTEAMFGGAERALRAMQAEAQLKHLRLELTGPYALAATSARVAKHDFTWSSFETVGLILLLYFLIYRRPHGLHLLVACTFLPLLVGFGIYAMVCGRITPLTAVAGAILGGLGIDYAIQSLHHHQRLRREGMAETEAAHHTATDQFMPLLGACVSACMGFAAVACTRTPAMKQLALLAVLCLFTAFAAAITLLPATLLLIGQWKAQRGKEAQVAAPQPMEARFEVGHLAVAVAQKPKRMLTAFAVICALGCAGALAGYLHPAQGVGLYALHPSPNPALEAQERMAKHFGKSEGAALALVKADSQAQLLQTCARLREVGQAAGFRVMSVGDLVPMPRVYDAAPSRKWQEANAKEIEARLLAAAKAEGFNPKAFAAYAAFVRDNLDSPAPTFADLPKNLAGMVLPKKAAAPSAPATAHDSQSHATASQITETLAILTPTRVWDSADARDTDINQLRLKVAQEPGVVLTGPDVLSVVMRAQVRDDLPLALMLAALGIFLWHALTCRKVLDTALSLIPSLAGLLAAASLAYCKGIEWNAITLAALPLIMGTGVDGNLFLVLFARERAGQGANAVLDELNKGTLAMLMIALTTLAGFGTLAFGSTPAVRDLGLLTSVGVAGAVFASFACIMPVLWLAEKRRTAAV